MKFERRIARLEKLKPSEPIDHSGWIVEPDPKNKDCEIIAIGRHWYYKDEVE